MPTTARREELVTTGFEYAPGDPICVRVVHREHRTTVSDGGAALARAGRPPRWREVAHRLDRGLVVNVSRQGAIFLPVVPVGPPEAEVIRRIAAASLAFYQELLDLSG